MGSLLSVWNSLGIRMNSESRASPHHLKENMIKKIGMIFMWVWIVGGSVTIVMSRINQDPPKAMQICKLRDRTKEEARICANGCVYHCGECYRKIIECK